MKANLPPKLKKLSPVKQRELDLLLDKNSEGDLSETERSRLNALVAQVETLSLENAKRLAEYANRDRHHKPPGATPVTVWVTPVATTT